jgi:hypothetical protein
MKKIISANVEKTLADKLELMSKESFPHVSKSAIVEYALENVNVENFIKGENNGNSEKTSKQEKTSNKKR